MIVTPHLVPGATPVSILAMSTREPSDRPGEVYSGERTDDFSLMNVVVSVPPDDKRRIGQIQWPRSGHIDPERDFATLALEPLKLKETDRWFDHVAGRNRKVLIFVHGFNNTFEEAAYRLAQIVHDSGTDAAPILFSWPSRGKPFEYLYDRESATYARDALEDLLAKTADDPNVTDVTILAHSMGNWVAMEALRQMAIRRGAVPPKIRNVIMAAPDVDVDVFRAQYAELGAKRPHITVFLSQDDSALSLSRWISGDKDRLGGVDPEQEPYRSKLAAMDIVTIDLTKLRARDRYHHDKFASSPEVVRLIGERLIGGQAIGGSEQGVGQMLDWHTWITLPADQRR